MILRPGKLINPSVLFKRPSFLADLSDAGGGEVDLSLRFGTGSATFTRSTIATTIGSTGLIIPVSSGVARSYYDPTTLQYMGYLAEGARTNLCLQSNAFDTTWANTRSSEAYTAGVTAPNGDLSSWKIVEDSTAANSHLISQNITIAAATVYTVSCFIRAGERGFARLLLGDTGGNNCVRVDVDLATGTLANGTTSGAGWTYISSAAQSFGNGWWRVSVTGTSAGATNGSVIIYMASALGTIVYNGDGTSGIYTFGAQLEAGTFPSTYIPTAASQVTRNADVLTYPSAGNVAAGTGTLYAEAGLLGNVVGAYPGIVTLSTDGNNYICLGKKGGASLGWLQIANGGATQASIDPMSDGIGSKFAISWATNNVLGCVAGGSVGSDLTATIPSITTINVGVDFSGGSQLFNGIKNIRIWLPQFTAAQLQAITV